MTEEATRLTVRDRIKWWVYGRCFAYCVRAVHPDADPADFCLLDQSFFVALSREEAQEIIKEAPEQAWRLENLLVYG